MQDQISIHAPHARSDPLTAGQRLALVEFQSTLLMRGATSVAGAQPLLTNIFQSTLLMRGATQRGCSSRAGEAISIHAPHARSDAELMRLAGDTPISIHAPHARSDFRQCSAPRCQENFNPRSSCEERLEPGKRAAPAKRISIHAPHARSDKNRLRGYHDFEISIHAPHARSDPATPMRTKWSFISIHAPHARSDIDADLARVRRSISIHAPHARSDCVTFKH